MDIFFFSFLNWNGSVWTLGGFCEKYSGLLLIENGNVFMFGSLCIKSAL